MSSQAQFAMDSETFIERVYEFKSSSDVNLCLHALRRSLRLLSSGYITICYDHAADIVRVVTFEIFSCWAAFFPCQINTLPLN